MTVWHGGQVRFKDNKGRLIDYAPELEKIDFDKTEQSRSLDGYSFTNKQGDSKHYLPEKLKLTMKSVILAVYMILQLEYII